MKLQSIVGATQAVAFRLSQSSRLRLHLNQTAPSLLESACRFLPFPLSSSSLHLFTDWILVLQQYLQKYSNCEGYGLLYHILRQQHVLYIRKVFTHLCESILQICLISFCLIEMDPTYPRWYTFLFKIGMPVRFSLKSQSLPFVLKCF